MNDSTYNAVTFFQNSVLSIAIIVISFSFYHISFADEIIDHNKFSSALRTVASSDLPVPEQFEKFDSEKLNSDSLTQGRNAIGVGLGLSSGIGLQYRRYLSNFMAIRASGFMIGTSKQFLFSVGLGLQQDWRRTNKYRFYTFESLAMHLFPSNTFWLVPGLGLGLEKHLKNFRNGLSFYGELSLSPTFDANSSNFSLVLIAILPQIGIHYIF